MERIVYDRMAALDTRHWWYRARRDILGRYTLTRRHAVMGWLATAVMAAAVVAMIVTA